MTSYYISPALSDYDKINPKTVGNYTIQYTNNFNGAYVFNIYCMTTGANKTINIIPSFGYQFLVYDWGFYDNDDARQMSAVIITTLPTSGILTHNGKTFPAGTSIPWADLNNGLLTYTGTKTDSFTFQVVNNAKPPVVDPNPKTMTMQIVSEGIGTKGIGKERWSMLELEIGGMNCPPNVSVPSNQNVGIISNATWSGGIVTITTTAQYISTLSVGQPIAILGMWPTGYNGAFTVTSLGTTTFTYNLTVNPGDFIANDSAGTVVSTLLTSPISAASWTNGIATFTASTNLQVGQTIAISGMGNYNGTYSVHTVEPTKFSAIPIVNPGSLGLVSNATWTNNVATITTSPALVGTLSVGQKIVVANVISSGPSSYNGTWIITALGTNTFSYSLNVNPGTYSSCGTICSVRNSGYITDQYLGPITWAAWANNVVTFTTTAACVSSLTIGQTVTLLGTLSVLGQVPGSPVGFNNTYTVASKGTTTFTCALNTNPGIFWNGPGSLYSLRPANGVTSQRAYNGTVISNLIGQVSSASWASNTVTITTTPIFINTLAIGQKITISGISPSRYNGLVTITSLGTNTFTYTLGSNPGTYVNGGMLYVHLPDYTWYIQAISMSKMLGCTAVVHEGTEGYFNDGQSASYFSQVALLRELCHSAGLKYIVSAGGPANTDDGGGYQSYSSNLDGSESLFDGGDPCSWAEGMAVNQQVFQIQNGQIVPYNDALTNVTWQNFGFVNSPYWWCQSPTTGSCWTWGNSFCGNRCNATVTSYPTAYKWVWETGQPTLVTQDSTVTRHATGLAGLPLHFYMPQPNPWQPNTVYPDTTILNIVIGNRQMLFVPMKAGTSGSVAPNWSSTPASYEGNNSFVLTESTGLQWAYCGDFNSELARICPIIVNKKYQFYDVSVWVKTNNYVGDGVNYWLLNAQGYGPGSDTIGTSTTPSSLGWTQLHMYWNTAWTAGSQPALLIETGITGAGSEVWFDDWQITPVPLNHMLRRDETPISLTSLDGTITYKEGTDFTGSSTACPALSALVGTPISTNSITDAQGQLGKVVNDPLVKLNWCPGNGFINDVSGGSLNTTQTTFTVTGGQSQIQTFDVPFTAVINSPTNPYSQKALPSETVFVTNIKNGVWTVVRGTPAQSYSRSNGYITISGGTWDQYHDAPPPMTVVPGGALSSLPNGTQLLFSWYHVVWQQWYYGVQRTLCMNQPNLLSKWAAEAQFVVQNWQADGYFLELDERRFVGWDTCCGYPNGTAGDAIAGNVNSTVNSLKNAFALANRSNPLIPANPLIAIWQDMMDPYHNGEQTRFIRTSTDSSITGATGNPITDKSIIMANWNHSCESVNGQYGYGYIVGSPLRSTQQFFAVNGFQQLMSGYCGGDTSIVQTWLTSALPFNCIGGLFTYWDQLPNLGPNTQEDLNGNEGVDLIGFVADVNSLPGYTDNYIGSGEIQLNGQATATYSFNFNYAGNGSIVLRGNTNDISDDYYTGNGTVVLSGNAETTYTSDYTSIGSGSVNLNGETITVWQAKYDGSGEIKLCYRAIATWRALPVPYHKFHGTGKIRVTGKATCSASWNVIVTAIMDAVMTIQGTNRTCNIVDIKSISL